MFGLVFLYPPFFVKLRVDLRRIMLMFQPKSAIINYIKLKKSKKGDPFFHAVNSRHDTSLVTVEIELGAS